MLILCSDQRKHQAVALFLLHTKVTGPNIWLASVRVTYKSRVWLWVKGAGRKTRAHDVPFVSQREGGAVEVGR